MTERQKTLDILSSVLQDFQVALQHLQVAEEAMQRIHATMPTSLDTQRLRITPELAEDYQKLRTILLPLTTQKLGEVHTTFAAISRLFGDIFVVLRDGWSDLPKRVIKKGNRV